MYSQVHIQGFRTFEELVAKDLTRVNLLVGTNNCGKTSFLEAIELLVGAADPTVLQDVLSRRGERKLSSTGGSDRRSRLLDARHLFHGHDLAPGRSFEITGTDPGPTNGDERVVYEVKEHTPELLSDSHQHSLFDFIETDSPDIEEPAEVPDRALAIVRQGPDRELKWVYRLSPSLGILGRYPATRHAAMLSKGRTDSTEPLLVFLGTGQGWGMDLNDWWDRVVLTPQEDTVLEALRIIQPDIQRIASVETSRRSAAASGFFVKLEGTPDRIPLGTFGDGVKRLLALALALSQVPGGALLVDEIDTGLHYSVMEQVWKLLIEMAGRLDVQVFATTHSADCFRSLASIQQKHPDLARKASVHRIDPGERSTVRYSAREVRIAAEQHMEIRG